MSQRLTRKEIKRDELAEAMGRGMDFASRNARRILGGVVAVVLVALLGVAALLFLQHREQRAQERLDAAIRVMEAPVDVAAPRPQDPDEPSFADGAARRARAVELFQAVREDFGGSDAAAVAGLYLARVRLEEGDPAAARELWRVFVDEHPEHLLAGQTRLNLIQLDRQQGEAERVASELENMLAAEEAVLPKDVVLWELAQTYEKLDQQDKAQSTYQRLVESYPQSAYSALARQKTLGAPGGLAGGLPSFG